MTTGRINQVTIHQRPLRQHDSQLPRTRSPHVPANLPKKESRTHRPRSKLASLRPLSRHVFPLLGRHSSDARVELRISAVACILDRKAREDQVRRSHVLRLEQVQTLSAASTRLVLPQPTHPEHIWGKTNSSTGLEQRTYKPKARTHRSPPIMPSKRLHQLRSVLPARAREL